MAKEGASNLLLEKTQARVTLHQLHVLRDPSRSASVAEIARQYQQNPGPVTAALNLGFTSDAVWVAFQMARANELAPQHWWLEVEQPLLMDVVLYEEQSDGTFAKTSGNVEPDLRQHQFDYRVPTFKLTLSDLKSKTYFLRILTQTSMSASLVLWQPQEFVKDHAESRFLWGGIYGACLMIVLFYGVWWLWTRERIHLVYSLYVLVNLLASFFSAAWPRQIFPHMTEETFLIWTGLWISLAAPVGTFFTFEVLRFQHGVLSRLPHWVKGLSMVMFGISFGLVLMGHYGAAMPLIQSYMLIMMLLSSILAAWLAWRGERGAQFFLLAFSIFYVGITWRFLKNIGILDPNFWSNNAYQFGAFGHMLVMSVSVFANYSRLRREKEQIEFRLQAESQLRQQQATFLGMVSHEFRTPLSIISTTAENLLAERSLSDQSRTRVEKITRANKRLSALMDEYLSFERLIADAGTTDHAMLDLEQLARSVVNESSDAEGPLVHLQAAGSVWVKGDRELLRVALQNLINNARRHSPDSDVVKVRVARQGDSAELSVEDQGPGIEAGEQKNIFEKFFRGHNALSKPGTGMGLYLVKSIVEQHGGEVMQRNLQPVGCQFLIRLPAN